SIDEGGRHPMLRSVVRKLGLGDIALKVTRFQPVPEYDDPDGPAWRVMSAILRRWIAEHGHPVLIVPLPLYHFVEEISDPTSYQKRFSELAGQTGCILHDPLPDLLRYSAAQRREFRFQRD